MREYCSPVKIVVVERMFCKQLNFISKAVRHTGNCNCDVRCKHQLTR